MDFDSVMTNNKVSTDISTDMITDIMPTSFSQSVHKEITSPTSTSRLSLIHKKSNSDTNSLTNIQPNINNNLITNHSISDTNGKLISTSKNVHQSYSFCGHSRGSSLGSGLTRLQYISAMKNRVLDDSISPSKFVKTPSINLKSLEKLAQLENEISETMSPQDHTEFILARIQKQNALLDADPKSVCIESNLLKTQSTTLNHLLSHIYERSSLHSDIQNQNDDDMLYYAETTNPEKYDIGPEGDVNEKLSESLKQSIPDWDFWYALLQDYSTTAQKLPRLVSAKIQAGIPPKIRGLVWQAMTQSTSTYLETMYDQLVKEKSPYDRIIRRDLYRTFPHVKLFKEEGGIGQTRLENILKAYSIYDPLVGYCQGLGFLVGPLLMNLGEKEAFCVFVRLMETYDMRGMFTLNMEGLPLRLYQFSTFLEQILPRLHTHFAQIGITPSMYASQWFLSLFAYAYPLPLVHRILDIAFAEGAPETIFRVAIAMLAKNEEHLLQLEEFEELFNFLMNGLFDAYNGASRDVIKDAMSRSNQVTKEKIEALEQRWIEQEEQRRQRNIEVTSIRFGAVATNTTSTNNESSKTTTKLNRDVLERQNSSQSDQMAYHKEAVLLHQQVEDLLNALTALQKEHTQLTEVLVKERMEKMDWVNKCDESNHRIKDLEEEITQLKGKLAERAAITNGLIEDINGNINLDSLTEIIVNLKMETNELGQMNVNINKRCAQLTKDLDEANSANILLQERIIELRESEAKAIEEVEGLQQDKINLEKDWRERLAESRKLVLALQNHSTSSTPSNHRESLLGNISTREPKRASMLSFSSLMSNENGEGISSNMRELKLARRASTNLSGIPFTSRNPTGDSEDTNLTLLDAVNDANFKQTNGSSYSMKSVSTSSSRRSSATVEVGTSGAITTLPIGIINGTHPNTQKEVINEDDENFDELETPRIATGNTFSRQFGKDEQCDVQYSQKISELEMQLHEMQSRLEDAEAECDKWKSRVDGLRTLMTGTDSSLSTLLPSDDITTPKANYMSTFSNNLNRQSLQQNSTITNISSTITEKGKRFSEIFQRGPSMINSGTVGKIEAFPTSTISTPSTPNSNVGCGVNQTTSTTTGGTWGGLAKRMSSNWFGGEKQQGLQWST